MIISMVVMPFLSSNTALLALMRGSGKRYERRSGRQTKPELAARTNLARHPDLATVRLDQLFGDRQP